MKAILALDQGTTSSRAIVFDSGGSIVASAQVDLPQSYPRPGWVEHDPMQIWQTQLEAAQQALIRAGLKAGDIAALGIVNQRETTVVWDRRTGVPIHPAIVWQDRRTSDFCDTLKKEGHEAMVQQRTGLVLDPYFSGSKVAWLLENVPGARSRAERGELAFGTVDSWLVWNLTRGELHVTDPSNASRTLFYNLHTGAWDPELLALFGVPESMLPAIVPSSGVLASTASGIFDGNGSIPIAGLAGDQQAALFGQTCFDKGLAKNTYGTGCFLLMNIGTEPKPSRHRLLTTVAWQATGPRQFALEGSVFIGGAVVQWLRDGLGIIQSASEVEALAASVPDSDGVYVVPAFAGLGAPHWDPYARGTISGLTRGSTKGHIARAALEGIAFQVADVMEVMARDSEVRLDELRVDGGASANNLLMQFQADILQVPVVRPKVIETTALGAAFLAGLAVGYWSGPEDLRQVGQIERRFEPMMRAGEVLERRARWSKALDRTREWMGE